MLRCVFYLLLFFYCGPSNACSCFPPYLTTTIDYNETAAIFIGKFEKQMPGIKNMVADKFIVTKWYKGDTSKHYVIVHTGIGVSDCGLGRLKAGHLYLVYANSYNKILVASRCGKTTFAPIQDDNYDTNFRKKYDHKYLANTFIKDTQFLNKIICKIQQGGYQKIYYDNGKLMSEGRFTNGQPDGKWKYYYPNGKLSDEGVYRNGVRDSIWAEYGDKILRQDYYTLSKLLEYKDGLPTFWEVTYFDHYPQKYDETYRLKGTDKWVHKIYHSNGSIRVMMTHGPIYTDKMGRRQLGLLDGPMKDYHENGKIQQEGECYKGRLTGTWREYDDKGNLIRTWEEKTKAEIDIEALKD